MTVGDGGKRGDLVGQRINVVDFACLDQRGDGGPIRRSRPCDDTPLAHFRKRPIFRCQPEADFPDQAVRCTPVERKSVGEFYGWKVFKTRRYRRYD